MKKFLLLATIPFMLTACGGDDETTDINSNAAENADKLIYETDDFSILFPKDWEIIESDSFTSNVPEETIVGFRNNFKNNIFTTNLNIAQTTLDQESVDSLDFAKSSLARAKKNLVNFNQIGLEDYEFTLGDEKIATFISDFEGRKSASEATIHFKQLHVVNDGNGYTVTGAYPPTEDENTIVQIEEMIESFQFK